MPGRMPWLESTWASAVPEELFWRMVSSCMMTPLMNSAAPGEVKSISRYVRRLSSVDWIDSASNRLVRVGTVSSAARMPFPSATSAIAVLSRSWLIMRMLPSTNRPRGGDPRPGDRGPFSADAGATLPIRPTRARWPPNGIPRCSIREPLRRQAAAPARRARSRVASSVGRHWAVMKMIGMGIPPATRRSFTSNPFMPFQIDIENEAATPS